MKKRFLCSWKDEGKDEAEPFLSNSHEEAYQSFLSHNSSRAKIVLVWDEDEDDPVEYSEHIKSEKELESIQKNNENKPLKGFEQKTTESVGEKLDKLYDVMNHIRWIGLSIGGMFALTFIVPQCTGS